MPRLIFLGIIALFLLGLYSYAIWYSVQVLQCINATPACVDYPKELGEGQKLILSLVGGLISALVISVLAVTPPNSSPDKTLLASVQPTGVMAAVSIPELTQTLTKVLTYAYLTVWLACGIASVIYGFVIDYKTPVPELTAAAKSWLGLAVAAAYAFFGLKTQ